MGEYPRIEPPRQAGRSYETTTMAVRVDTRDAFDVLAERWNCSRFEAMRYSSDVGLALANVTGDALPNKKALLGLVCDVLILAPVLYKVNPASIRSVLSGASHFTGNPRATNS